MTKESQITSVLRFEDGHYLGSFGKVDTLLDAIKFNGDWENQIVLKNNFLIKGEKYEILHVKMDVQIISNYNQPKEQ